MKWISWNFSNESLLKNQPIIENNVATFNYPCEFSDKCSFYTVVLNRGRYNFQLWGSRGGKSRFANEDDIHEDSPGLGSYVSGNINLKKQTQFYLYIGGKGEDQTCNKSCQTCGLAYGGFNGGGKGGCDYKEDTYPESTAGGGGSTDIRLISGDTFESLLSRLIVASGGGGGSSTLQSTGLNNDYRGGHGGIERGETFNNLTAPGEQTKYMFGKGSDGVSLGADLSVNGGSTGGSGSGYFGGISYDLDKNLPYLYPVYCTGGAGGSSFVSGLSSCNALSEQSTEDNMIFTGKPYHYSNYVFHSIVTKSGKDNGNNDDGKIVITYLGDYTKMKRCRLKKGALFLYF